MAQPDEPSARGYNEEEIRAAEEEFDALVNAGLVATAAAAAAAVAAEPIAATVTDATIAPALTVWNTYVAEVLVPALTRIFKGSAAMFVDTAEPVLLALSYDLTDIAPIDEPATEWMRLASNRLRAVSDIVWEEIRQQLVEGVQAGDGIPELAQRVRDAAGFSEPRARATARTEVAAASNGGSITQARALGLDMQKQWEATSPTDGRTRVTHLAAHHQTVDLGAKFVVGDDLLDFPGDPTGSAEEVINCRCAVTFLNIRRREEPPDVAGAAEFMFDQYIQVAATFREPDHPRDRSGKFAEKRGSGGARSAGLVSGEAALNSAPVRLKPDRGGHAGSYADAELTGIEGDDVKQALSEMEGLEYQVTNDHLRGKMTSDVPADVQARIDAVDRAMAASPLSEDVVVHRGIKDGAKTFGDVWYGEFAEGTFEEQDEKWPRWEAGERPDLTGMEWQDLAYSHTTVKDDRLEGYARKLGGLDPVAMNIVVPKGTRAVQMSGMDLEGELMLERGLRFRVVKDHGADENGVRQWDVEVISNG